MLLEPHVLTEQSVSCLAETISVLSLSSHNALDEHSKERLEASQNNGPSMTSPNYQPSFIDVKFPTWSLRAELKVPDSPTLSQPPLLSLSQPLFPPSKDNGRLLELKIPTLMDPNSPYVPWDSPARREFLLRSPSLLSQCSHSRPPSRSGACAPEPNTPSVVDLKSSASRPPRIQRALRSFGRNVSGAFRRMGKQRQTIPKVKVESYSPNRRQELGDPSRLHRRSRRASSMSARSGDTTNTDSLGTWLAYRRQRQLEHGDTPMMTLDEYERRGSWMGTVDECGLADCSVHRRQRTPSLSSVMTHDSLYRAALTHRSRRSSVSVSVRSQRSISRMSLGKRGPPPTRLSQLVHSSSFISDSPLRLTSEGPPRLAPMAERVLGESSLSQEITATLRRSESTAAA